jgi:HupE / UreJ protein
LRSLWLVALTVLGSISAQSASAHVSSDSFLQLAVQGATATGHWDIALRDLDTVLNLDADGDGQLRWGEVRQREAEIADYALQRLAVRSDSQSCSLKSGRVQVDRHQGEAFAVLPLSMDCGSGATAMALTYRLFEDVDATHRGLLDLQLNGVSYAASLEPSAVAVQFAASGSNASWRAFREFLATGIDHIWSGYDHLLFLLSLLLPAVYRRQQPQLEAHQSLRAALIDVAKVVTAFTVAHSLTLALATLNIVNIPARLSESAIALSIVIAALNNLRPTITTRRWMLAFAFGLLHGFGFANVLTDLGLPAATLAIALFGFNVGVEAGQLAIVAVFLPVAYALRRTLLYRRAILVGGSGVVVVLGSYWLLERALGVSLLNYAQWAFR